MKRYKLDWQNVLIDGNFVGLFYSQPGECHQHFALLEYFAGDENSEDMVEDVRLLYELKLESLESFEVLQNSTISWHLKNDSLFRLTQRFTGREMHATTGSSRASGPRQSHHKTIAERVACETADR